MAVARRRLPRIWTSSSATPSTATPSAAASSIASIIPTIEQQNGEPTAPETPATTIPVPLLIYEDDNKNMELLSQRLARASLAPTQVLPQVLPIHQTLSAPSTFLWVDHSMGYRGTNSYAIALAIQHHRRSETDAMTDKSNYNSGSSIRSSRTEPRVDPAIYLIAQNNILPCRDLGVGTILGQGGNAIVYKILSPATTQLGMKFDIPTALKSNLIPLTLEPTAQNEKERASMTPVINSGGKVSKLEELLQQYPCWQMKVQNYECPFEHETEVYLLALASKLFVDGITPHMPLHITSFFCTAIGGPLLPSSTPSLLGPAEPQQQQQQQVPQKETREEWRRRVGFGKIISTVKQQQAVPPLLTGAAVTSSSPPTTTSPQRRQQQQHLQQEGILHTIQEQYGAIQKPYNGHVLSLVHLPELLQIIYPKESIVRRSDLFSAIQTGDNDRIQKVLSQDFIETSITISGESLLKRVSVEIMIAVLHTIALAQHTYGMQWNDLKPANILFKLLATAPGSSTAADILSSSLNVPYFRNQSLSSVQYFAYEIQPDRFFYIPNRSILAKLIDFGMGAAYRVPVKVDETTTIFTTEITNHTYTFRRYEDVRLCAKLGVMSMNSLRGPLQLEQLLYDEAISQGIESSLAAQMAREASTTNYMDYQREYLRIANSRNRFGITGEFQPGYDAHYFIATLADQLRHWLPSRIRLNDPRSSIHDDYGPIFHLQQRFHLTLDADTARPVLDNVTQASPQEMLNYLYQIASSDRDSLSDMAERRVHDWLQSYLIRPAGTLGSDDVNIIIVPIQPPQNPYF